MTDPDIFGPPLGAPPVPRDLEELVAVVAHQRGLVTRAQCLSAGLSDRAIGHRLRTQRWVSVRRGVYLTVPGRKGWWWDATAALLSVGTGAAWAFGTAGFAQGLIRTAPSTVHLVVDASATPEAPDGVRVHRSRYADARVDDLHWPWRTRADETILDLAESGTVDEITALLGRAFQRGLTTEETLRSLLDGRARHPHRALLQDLLADVASGAESAMEVRFLRDVERAQGLPRGRRQVPLTIGNVRVHDIAYEEQRVLVELDGRLGHDGEDRVRDGIRDRRSATRAWLTVRAFWNDVAGAPCTLATEVGEVLNQRGWRDRAHPCRRRSCVVLG